MVDQAEIHRKCISDNVEDRREAADRLRANFTSLPDKEAAWKDLHRLTGDEDNDVRSQAARALGAAFAAVPDKEAAWKELHRLTCDEDSLVRWGAARALGAVFAAVPDKGAAWKDLHRLTGDEERSVRVPANHSLGEASIFRATEAVDEEDFRRELENSLKYFERSAAEASFNNPANFCLPFYRSFYVLTFMKEGSEAEVQRSLAEAKSASEGSKSREDLLEAVENLSNALKETQSLRERGLEAAKCNLNSYRRYCDRAAELLDETEERAPGATRLIKRGKLIIDHQIKELLKEIKDKSEEICKTGAPLEAELGCKIQKHAASALEKTYNPIDVQKKVNQILGDISTWSDSIQDLHLRKYTKGKLEEAKNLDIIGQLEIINILQVAIMSGKNSSPKYIIESSKVQIAEGEGHHQEMEASSRSKIESETDQRPWYKDRNYLIALIAAVITAIGVLIAYIQL